MAGYKSTVYVVQRETGEVIAVKLTHQVAQAIAKREAPCRVIAVEADKTDDLNVVVYAASRRS